MSTYNRATLYQQFRKDIAKEYNTEVRAAKAYANSIKERAMEAARAKAEALYNAAFEDKIGPAREKYNTAISNFNVLYPKVNSNTQMDPIEHANLYSERRARIGEISRPMNISPDTVVKTMDELYGKKNLTRWDEDDFKRAFEWLGEQEPREVYG